MAVKMSQKINFATSSMVYIHSIYIHTQVHLWSSRSRGHFKFFYANTQRSESRLKSQLFCGGSSYGFLECLKHAKQVRKIQTPIFSFFWKIVVNITIKELGSVSNESLGNSTHYRDNLKLLKPSIFLKNNGFLKFYTVITISQKNL